IRQYRAARDYSDRAVVIFERLIRDHPDVPECKNMLARTRVTRAQTTCLMGDYGEAVVEVETGVAMAPGDGLTCYNAACTNASIFVAAGHDTKLSTTERQRLAEHYATRAIELFRQSKKAGFFQRRGTVTSLTNDPELAPLREREDFKAFMRELESDGQRSSKSPQSIK